MGYRALRTALAFALLALPACGGGGTVPAVSQAGAGLVAQPAAAAVASASGGLRVLGYGGLRGTAYAAHASGDAYDYAEDVTVDFDRAFVSGAIAAHVALVPAAPFTTYATNYGKRLQLTVRKVPGTTYALTLDAATPASDGTTLGAPATFAFRTPAAVTVAAPARATPGEPYRYGAGAHPFSASLAGASADRQIALFADAGVRFVRIDYPASQIEPSAGTYDFSTEDAILTKLVARGITEMPIVEQYSVPAWATQGLPYPAIFAQPADFASYAGAIAAHLRDRFPQVTRIELFNEPNLHGWWSNPNPAYAATDGSATAAYALAAYAAIKAANPNVSVVGPALADGGDAVDPRTFLATMMRAGCRVGTCWDALSVHAYRWSDPAYAIDPAAMNRFAIYRDLQQVALANGEPSTPHAYITEWAFSVDPSSASAFDPQVQARYLATGFNLMLADPTLDGISWTNMYNPDQDFWGHTALTDAAFTPLPAYATYRAFATY